MNSAFLWFRPLNQSLFSVKNMPDDSRPTQFLQLVNWLVPDGLITSLPNLLSIHTDLPFLVILYKWNHIICVFVSGFLHLECFWKLFISTIIVVTLFDYSHSHGYEGVFHMVLIHISLMTNDIKLLFMCLLAIQKTYTYTKTYTPIHIHWWNSQCKYFACF